MRMEKIQTYEQYSELLAAFKRGRSRCGTNKLLTRDELMALIEAGKLYYEQIEDTIWLFVDQGYFYAASFYVPEDKPIRMHKQGKDAVVELMGKGERYDIHLERKLCEAGYQKYDRHFEYARDLADIFDQLDGYVKANQPLWSGRGLTARRAVKEDYPRLWDFWMERFGTIRYTIMPMTDSEREEMERNGQCLVICDARGEIVATWVYLTRNKTAYGYNLAARYPERGLGTFVLYLGLVGLCHGGYDRYVTWLRDDNLPTLKLHGHILEPTGKFYWQFLYPGRDA